jgi:hypothetical protein
MTQGMATGTRDREASPRTSENKTNYLWSLQVAHLCNFKLGHRIRFETRGRRALKVQVCRLTTQ